MCGIAGTFNTQSAGGIDLDYLHKTKDVLLHRGPDDAGIHSEPGLGLMHRRLAIIDLSGGHQPLYNADRTVVTVYNGEIYNFAELRDTLEAKGYQFSTRSDTEVIVNGWSEWGPACVERFRGMFAFALWDSKTQSLFLARDRLGIKPIYFAQVRDELIFASELKALMCHPKLPREIDTKAVEEYFALGYIPEPRSILRSVQKLEPGHYLLQRRGAPRAQPCQYWDVPYRPNGVTTLEQACEQLVERLTDAVNVRLVSEVPVGGFLSGGVDSSVVVATMAGLSNDPVNSCTISFGESSFDEADYAQTVAERFSTNHFVKTVDPNDFSLVSELGKVYDEPYADSSALPTYRLCQLAREHVTVALSGDGGDEILTGYRRQRLHMNEERLRSTLPAQVRRPLFGLLGRAYPKADWAPRFVRAKTTFEALAKDSVAAYFGTVSRMSDAARGGLYSERLKSDLQDYNAIELFRRHAANAPDEHPMLLMQYLDIKTYLSGDILTKVDRASMAHSLEVRVPILDHHFVEWAYGLEPQFKLSGGQGKRVLKKAYEPQLPKDILYRPKQGFSIPIAQWFRGPLKDSVREAVLGNEIADCGLFEQEYLHTVVSQHQGGMHDHSDVLWSLMMFRTFLSEMS